MGDFGARAAYPGCVSGIGQRSGTPQVHGEQGEINVERVPGEARVEQPLSPVTSIQGAEHTLDAAPDAADGGVAGDGILAQPVAAVGALHNMVGDAARCQPVAQCGIVIAPVGIDAGINAGLAPCTRSDPSVQSAALAGVNRAARTSNEPLSTAMCSL